MPEPVISTLASTIAVAGLAYHSAKALVEFIDSVQGAPELLDELKGDAQAVCDILESLQEFRDSRVTTNGSDDLENSLRCSERQVKDCEKACTELKTKLQEWFPDSKWTTAIKVNFSDKKIKNQQWRLRDTAARLNVALMFCSFKFNGLHADKARKYETDMGTQFQRLSGMLEGLVLSREESTAAANVLGEQNQQLIMQQNHLAGRLDRQERLIKDAIQLCAAGLQETVKTTQSSISMKSMNDARQMLAVCDGDSEFIKDLNATFTAQDRSMQVGFTNDPEFALKFLLGKRN